MRVFDRLYRGGDIDDGFGLGLAIAAESVRALGGRLELEARDGGGATARIALPLARLVAA